MSLSHPKPKITSQKENKPFRVFISGLDSSGRTTVLHVTKFGESNITTEPVVGINVEIIAINDTSMVAMEEGGRCGMRAAQQLYYRGSSGLVFVVDSNDRERIDEARDKLHQMLNDEEVRNKPVLIFANKRDLFNSMTLDELREKLDLSKLNQNIKWYIQSASAIQNEGLQEGFTWLTNAMVKKYNMTKPIVDTSNDTKSLKKDFLSIFSMTSLKALLSKFV